MTRSLLNIIRILTWGLPRAIITDLCHTARPRKHWRHPLALPTIPNAPPPGRASGNTPPTRPPRPRASYPKSRPPRRLRRS